MTEQGVKDEDENSDRSEEAHSFTKPEIETKPHPDINYIVILFFIVLIFLLGYVSVPKEYNLILWVGLAAALVLLVAGRWKIKGSI